MLGWFCLNFLPRQCDIYMVYSDKWVSCIQEYLRWAEGIKSREGKSYEHEHQNQQSTIAVNKQLSINKCKLNTHKQTWGSTHTVPSVNCEDKNLTMRLYTGASGSESDSSSKSCCFHCVSAAPVAAGLDAAEPSACLLVSETAQSSQLLCFTSK